MNSIGGYSQAARKGVGGLISGLDTDELVKGMTSSTRSKIARLLQNQQSITWKRDAYRSVSSKLLDFSNKYTSFTSPTNLLSDKFYQSSNITVSGDMGKYISATGDLNSANGLSIKKIESLAANAIFNGTDSIYGNNKFSTGEISFDDKDINNFAGQTIKLTYGTKTYDVKIDESFTGKTGVDVANAINTALSNIEIEGSTDKLSDRINVSFTSDKFSIGLKDSTDTNNMKINSASGTVLTLMGLKAGTGLVPGETEITGSEVKNTSGFGTLMKFEESLKDKEFKFKLNGIEKTIIFTDADITDMKGAGTAVTLDAFKDKLQSKINDAFGSGKVTLNIEGGNKLSFQASNTTKFSLASGPNAIVGPNGFIPMPKDPSTQVNIALSIKDTALAGTIGEGTLKINGVEFNYTEDTAIKDLIADINNSKAGVKVTFYETTGTFNITSTETGAHTKIDISDTNTDASKSLSKSLFGSQTINEAGADAKIIFQQNGGGEFTVERSSNVFDVNGVTLTIKEGAKEAMDAAGGTPITFSGTPNTDEMIKGIKAMVDDYNTMVDFFNKQLSTKPDRKYGPLTDEQKEEMTEEQIKQWEEKAQTGILYADSDLRGITSDLRFAFAFDVEGIGTSLKDIGLISSNSYKDNGKITINEDLLKKAIQEKPDDVKRILTNKPEGDNVNANEYGLVHRVKNVIEKYAATTGEHKGVLIQKAGLKDSATELDSQMYKQLTENEKTIKEWKSRLLTEETRYYAQFTRLEQYMQQMNAQSSWLYQQTQ